MTENASLPQSSGIAPNLASLLCYLCTWLTAIIFLVIEKQNKEVRFHAWQSLFFGLSAIVIFVALSILSWLPVVGILLSFLSPLIMLGYFILWVILLIKAYQGEHFKLPYLGDFAEKQN
jgi:uncharacterized membrane protein